MLTIEDVAKELKVTTMMIYKAVNARKIKAIKVGAIWRISEEELERIKREGF